MTGDEYRATVNLEFSTQALTLGVNNLPNFLLVGAEWYVNRWGYHYLNKIDSMTYTSTLIDDASYSPVLGRRSGDRNEIFAAFYIQDEMHLIKDRMVLNASVRGSIMMKYTLISKMGFVGGNNILQEYP